MSDDDADNDGISQQGEPYATPVVTNEEDVSSGADSIGDQIPENVSSVPGVEVAWPELHMTVHGRHFHRCVQRAARLKNRINTKVSASKLGLKLIHFMALILLAKVILTSLLECATSLSYEL